MSHEITRQHCLGCHDDFYNGEGAERCWSAKTATMKWRYRIHFMTAPTVKGAFTKVRVPSCYHQVNSFMYYNDLPSFVRAADLNRSKRT